jgi:hypothetical protein
MPLYYVAKLAFVIWLQAPQTKARPPGLPTKRMRAGLTVHARVQGATILHVQYITPLLHKHENVIDLALEEGLKKARLQPTQCKRRRARC